MRKMEVCYNNSKIQMHAHLSHNVLKDFVVRKIRMRVRSEDERYIGRLQDEGTFSR